MTERFTKDSPTSSDVHTSSQVSSLKKKCPECGREYGKGYKSCPRCTKTKDSSATSAGSTLAKTFTTADPNRLANPLTRASTVFRLDPRLHSHPFYPALDRPAACRDCGMGTGAHPRMVLRPDPVSEPDPVAKSVVIDLDPSFSHYAVVKSAPEARYTLGPMYIPELTDAHGDFATATDLQRAAWDYVRETGHDRTIYLQHSTRPAGEWVEVMAWPHAVDASLQLTGPSSSSSPLTPTVTKSRFPAGTVYMGVVWEPWAWSDVKEGKLTGLSMGGWARRTGVESEVAKSLATTTDTSDLDEFLKHGGSSHDQQTHGNWARGGRSHHDSAVTAAVDSRIATAHSVEPALTSTLTDIAESLGGHMEGLDFKFKSRDGILDKVQRKVLSKKMDPVDAANSVTDVLRYTAVLPHDSHVPAMGSFIASMRNNGMMVDPSDIENSWVPGDAYAGVNTVFTHRKTGLTVEIQFHTPASWHVKQNINHAPYERYRAGKGSPAMREKLFRQMTTVSDAIPMPRSIIDVGIPVYKPYAA